MAKFGIFKICKKPNKKPSHISYYWHDYGIAVSSIYWRGEDKKGKYLIRCSNHWSAFINNVNEDCEISRCGMIKNSFFIIKGNINIKQRTVCGKVYIKNFKKINEYGICKNEKFKCLL